MQLRVLGGLLAMGLMLGLGGCKQHADFRDAESLEALVAMEGIDGKDKKAVEKLKADILSNREVIKQLESAQGRQSSFWNALGEQYRKNGMFAPALKAYQESLAIKVNNAPVLYRAGVMSAQLYKTEPDPAKAAALLDSAEKYYRQAIEFGAGHADSRYALAVLLLFERQDLPGAKEQATGLLVQRPEDSRAFFLQGRIAAMEGDLDKAAEWYERVLQSNASDEEKQQASENLEELRRR